MIVFNQKFYLAYNHIKINEKIKVDLSKKNRINVNIKNSEYEKPKEKIESFLEEVLREISTIAEENRERHYKEKYDLLISFTWKISKIFKF